jgi:isopentenyl diphosphate isomerase/L-lactate dehydrogenase-like FMN-dependent dehydrogenase
MLSTTLSTLRNSPVPGGGSHSPMAPSQAAPSTTTSPIAPPDRPARGTPMRVSPYTWDDLKWIRDQWSGPLIIKSILSADDARACVDIGADAIIVSNHGGRQLEGTPATMRVLPEVVDAVGSQVEVLLDSGVRRGSDVVKALALGARAVLIGRAYLWGLAAAGEPGVRRILSILRADMARTMELLGCHSIDDLDRSWLQPL